MVMVMVEHWLSRPETPSALRPQTIDGSDITHLRYLRPNSYIFPPYLGSSRHDYSYPFYNNRIRFTAHT